MKLFASKNRQVTTYSCEQIKQKLNMKGSVVLLGHGLEVPQPVTSTALLTLYFFVFEKK
jgi:hypothetical protein